MATLLEIQLKIDRNTTKTFTIGISDEKNEYGQNVDVFLPQTEEEIKQKVKREFVGNGKVFWTDGNILTAKDCPIRPKESPGTKSKP